MKIYSKFTDYYDSVVMYGIDPNISYVRNTEIIETTNKQFFDMLMLNQYDVIYPTLSYFYKYVLGFCGKKYYILSHYSYSHLNKINGKTYEGLSSILSYEEYKNNDKDNNKFNLLSSPNQFYKNHHNVKINDDFFRHINSPIWLVNITKQLRVEKINVIKNPNLRLFNFQRVIDPFTAYQQLQQYISNVLTDHPISAIIPDNIMRDKKGFDDKSFKMTSDMNKKTRRKNKLKGVNK